MGHSAYIQKYWKMTPRAIIPNCARMNHAAAKKNLNAYAIREPVNKNGPEKNNLFDNFPLCNPNNHVFIHYNKLQQEQGKYT